MTRVELERLRIVHSSLGDRVYIGAVNKKDKRLLNNKVDRTNDFLSVLVSWCGIGYERIITDDTGKRISVQMKYVEAEE